MTDVLIEKNNIRKNDYAGILIDGTEGVVRDCSIRFNMILDNDYERDPDVPVRIPGGKQIRFHHNTVEVDNPIPLLEYDVKEGDLFSNFNSFHFAKGEEAAEFVVSGEVLLGFERYQNRTGYDLKSKFLARGRDSSGSQTSF